MCGPKPERKKPKESKRMREGGGWRERGASLSVSMETHQVPSIARANREPSSPKNPESLEKKILAFQHYHWHSTSLAPMTEPNVQKLCLLWEVWTIVVIKSESKHIGGAYLFLMTQCSQGCGKAEEKLVWPLLAEIKVFHPLTLDAPL